MIEASAGRRVGAGRIATRPLAWLLWLLVALLVLAGAALAGVAAAVAAAPPQTSVGVADGAVDLPLDAEIRLSLAGWDARLEQAALYEASLGPDGRPGAERPVPIQASVLRASRLPEGAEYALRPVGDRLAPDASYRLVVQTSALVPSLPWPTAAPAEREVRFRTVRSPVPLAAAGPVRLKWGQPLQVAWDSAVDDVRVEATPQTPLRVSLDQASRRTAAIVLDDPADAETYRLTVTGTRDAGGVALGRSGEYTVVAPPRPALLDADAETPRVAEIGKPLALRFSTPMSRVSLAVEPPLTARWELDRRDPSVVLVTLDGIAQGASYTLRVAEAVARDGAPLAAPLALPIETPERLVVDELETGTDGGPVPVTAKPILAFAQPIRDRRAATAAISVSPPIPGRWEWLDDRRVQFVPLRALPYDTEVTIQVRPGPDGPRSTVGSYFEKPAILSFTTETDKLIDVDVTRQVMTLYQQGRSVRTLPVATGVPGADTPLGEFRVEYKMPVARFQGVNVDGSRYDIPDVHWVLAFMGDYTIHGAYWRSGFGRPGSNGCVSLTDEDAKTVFDWAPEGTRIRIHQ